MDINQITGATSIIRRATGAVRPFSDAATRIDINHAEYIANEVQHFALMWVENRQMADDGERDAIDARNHQAAIINRLVTALAPTRL